MAKSQSSLRGNCPRGQITAMAAAHTASTAPISRAAAGPVLSVRVIGRVAYTNTRADRALSLDDHSAWHEDSAREDSKPPDESVGGRREAGGRSATETMRARRILRGLCVSVVSFWLRARRAVSPW